MKYSIIKYFLLVSITFLIAANASGQSDLSSPYSRFGLGDIITSSPNPILKGMGGVSNAVSGRTILNPANPASYSSLDSLAFVFDAAFYMKNSTYTTGRLSEKGSNSSFSYVSVGISATKRWKFGLGVMPYSNREYNVITERYDEVTGAHNVAFEGEGGLNRVFFANGIKITDDLSVGVTASLIFGTLFDNTSVYYPDSTYFLNGKRSINMRISDFKFDYGVLYRLPISKYDVTIGLTYSQGANIASKRDLFIRNMFKGFGNQVENPIDTLSYIEDERVDIRIPDGFGVGLTIGKGEDWMVGADFNWSGWKGFTMNGANDSIQNSWNVALGASFKPESNSLSRYYKKMTYRAGLHYDQTYYYIYGQSINKFGVSVGLGLPIPRSLTSLNVALEFGTMGTIENNLIRETYVNLSVSMSIFDKWFIKKKYK